MTERAERLLAIADELGLTEKQRTFCLEYARTRNGVQSAEAAGYSGDYHTLASMAHENLNKPQIREYLQAIAKETGALQKFEQRVKSAAEVLERLSDQAFHDQTEFLRVDEQTGGFTWDLKAIKESGLGYLIKRISHDKETGAPVLEFYDAQAALDKLGKHYRLFSDNDGPSVSNQSVNIGQVLVQLNAGEKPEPGQLVGLAKGLLGKPIEVEAERVE